MRIILFMILVIRMTITVTVSFTTTVSSFSWKATTPHHHHHRRTSVYHYDRNKAATFLPSTTIIKTTTRTNSVRLFSSDVKQGSIDYFHQGNEKEEEEEEEEEIKSASRVTKSRTKSINTNTESKTESESKSKTRGAKKNTSARSPAKEKGAPIAAKKSGRKKKKSIPKEVTKQNNKVKSTSEVDLPALVSQLAKKALKERDQAVPSANDHNDHLYNDDDGVFESSPSEHHQDQDQKQEEEQEEEEPLPSASDFMKALDDRLLKMGISDRFAEGLPINNPMGSMESLLKFNEKVAASRCEQQFLKAQQRLHYERLQHRKQEQEQEQLRQLKELQQQQKQQSSSNSLEQQQPPILLKQDSSSLSNIVKIDRGGYFRKLRSNSEKTVLVLFAKPLINKQVTIAYASRIRELVQMLQQQQQQPRDELILQEYNPTPDLICFGGGASDDDDDDDDGSVSAASAGFVFFKQLCQKEGVSLKPYKFYIAHDTTTTGGSSKTFDEGKILQNIVNHILREHIAQWLAHSQETENLRDEFGMEREILRKKIHLHFRLLSSAYHLCNLNDIHNRSPKSSFLRPIELLKTSQVQIEGDIRNNNNNQQKKQREPVNGILDCSWDYKYCFYPFMTHPDERIELMRRCYLLNERLLPLLLNLEGVVAGSEFFQRDNYVVLASVRRSFIQIWEGLFSETVPTLRTPSFDLESYPPSDSAIDYVLECAVVSLGRCNDIVRPAGLHKKMATAAEFQRALRSLEQAIVKVRQYLDPDRPIDSIEDFVSERTKQEEADKENGDDESWRIA